MDNLACIYMDGKKYPCPFVDCETKWQMAKEAFEELRRRIDELREEIPKAE